MRAFQKLAWLLRCEAPSLTAKKEGCMSTAMTGADLHVQAAASYFPQAYEKNSKSASAGRALKPAYSSIL